MTFLYFLNPYLHVSLCRFDVEDVSLHLDGSMKTGFGIMILIYCMKTCNAMLVLLFLLCNTVILMCTWIFFGCFYVCVILLLLLLIYFGIFSHVLNLELNLKFIIIEKLR